MTFKKSKYSCKTWDPIKKHRIMKQIQNNRIWYIFKVKSVELHNGIYTYSSRGHFIGWAQQNSPFEWMHDSTCNNEGAHHAIKFE